MRSDTNVKEPLSADMKVLLLLMGDFIHHMEQGRVSDGMALLPHVGAYIDMIGMPPFLKFLILSGQNRNMN